MLPLNFMVLHPSTTGLTFCTYSSIHFQDFLFSLPSSRYPCSVRTLFCCTQNFRDGTFCSYNHGCTIVIAFSLDTFYFASNLTLIDCKIAGSLVFFLRLLISICIHGLLTAHPSSGPLAFLFHLISGALFRHSAAYDIISLSLSGLE